MIKKINAPGGAKLISVLYWIFSVLFILIGATITVLPFLIRSALETNLIESVLPISISLATALLVGFGIFSIGFGVLCIFVARGLWKGKDWARIVAIILSGFGIIFSIIGIVSGDFVSLIYLIIHLWIVIYLTFNKRIRVAFSYHNI